MESGHRKLLPNPRAKANFISFVFFGWSIPFFRRAYNEVLGPGDVSEPLANDRSNVLGDRLERYSDLEIFLRQINKYLNKSNF